MKKFSSIALWVSIAITIVVAAMFFLGGETEAMLSTGGETTTPVYTDALMYWVYAIVLIGVAALVIFALKTLVTMFQTDAKAAIKSLGTVLAFVALMVICYVASPATEFSRIVNGETQSFSAVDMKMIDMWLYSIYALVAITVVLVIGFGVKKLIK